MLTVLKGRKPMVLDQGAGFPGGRLHVLSQRGPLTFHMEDGVLRFNQSGGGLSTAVGALARTRNVRWVASAHTEADRLAGRSPNGWKAGQAEVHLVDLPASVEQLHCQGFANPVLWFLQHGLGNHVIWPRTADAIAHAWFHGYVPANEAMAQRMVDLVDRTPAPVILVQDYHLYLAPRLLRQAIPNAQIAHFVHIPWPAPEAWTLLPRPVVRMILDGMLAADLLGFQTDGDVDHFLATCLAFGCKAGHATPTGKARPTIRSYPITADWESAKRLSEHAGGRLGPVPKGMKTIVRVDRLDPSKNIPAGFRAFGRLLERQPALRGRVRFLAHLQPSRSDLPEYQNEANAVFEVVRSVNRRFGTKEWQPIEVFYEENRALAMELLTQYDVLLVNSLVDGMNLVAKEGAVVNRRDGVLVLSERAGAWWELGWWALGIDPTNLAATAEALEKALNMPAAERQRRAAALRQKVGATTLDGWLARQLADLHETRETSVEGVLGGAGHFGRQQPSAFPFAG